MKTGFFSPKWYKILILLVLIGLFAWLFLVPQMFGSKLGPAPISDFLSEYTTEKNAANHLMFAQFDGRAVTRESYQLVSVYYKVADYEKYLALLPGYDLVTKDNPQLENGFAAQVMRRRGKVEFSHDAGEITDRLNGSLQKGRLEFILEREGVSLFCQIIKTPQGYVSRFVDYSPEKGTCTAYLTGFDKAEFVAVYGECDYSPDNEYPELTDFAQAQAGLRNPQVYQQTLPASEEEIVTDATPAPPVIPA